MAHPQTPRLHSSRLLPRYTAIMAVVLCLASACPAQAGPAGQPGVPWPDVKKYPGLLPEFARLLEKMQHNLKFPAARGQSRLLPLLPASTIVYAAFPNYGDVTYQALKIFQRELKESEVLRNWWQRGEPAKIGPQVEDALEKVYEVSQYLGEEVVISGAPESKEPSLLIMAEVRKPGLKPVLQQVIKVLAGKGKPPLRVLEPGELATVDDRTSSQQLLVLVRPDYVVAASSAAALRSLNEKLERNNREFIATSFEQRIAQAYEGGAGILAAADLQKILDQMPPAARDDKVFQRTGFSDLKYIVWEHKDVPGQPSSQMELSFTGLRRGMASWLAAPRPLGGLDFVSPGAVIAASVVLRNPAQIFDDVREIATATNPNAFAPVSRAEEALRVNLKEDVLRWLDGEVTLELDSPVLPAAVWMAILRVNDPIRLQRTLTTLLAAANLREQQFEEGGVSYHTVAIPSPKGSEIAYALVNGYLIVASSREKVAEAVRVHRSGESLSKARTFLAALPRGHSPEASALLYQDPVAMMAQRLQMLSPELAGAISQPAGERTPAVVCAYSEQDAIRQASSSVMMDAGAIMVAAAIAIPNLLRSRIAANEASAVGTIRTVNVAQITYSASYPERGFAPDLATLGPDAAGNGGTADHAGFIDSMLGDASCTRGKWCTKSGFRFAIKGVCLQEQCSRYVVVGTPVATNTGSRNFCSTSDGVVRYRAGPPLASPISVQECRTWTPLQ